MSRVTDLLKNAVELNLKYTSTLLHLTKDYVKDASDVVSREPASATPSGSAPPQRAPLLIAGRSGDTGNAAFTINNPSDKPMTVHLIVQGDLGDDRVKLDPARFILQPGEQTIVRIIVKMDDKLAADHDHAGQVVAPGLSSQGIPFIVRRLANAAAPAGSGKVDAAEPASQSKARSSSRTPS